MTSLFLRGTQSRTLDYHADGAGVAQLAERQPSKLNVASSNLVSRSRSPVSRLLPPSLPDQRHLGAYRRSMTLSYARNGTFGSCGRLYLRWASAPASVRPRLRLRVFKSGIARGWTRFVPNGGSTHASPVSIVFPGRHHWPDRDRRAARSQCTGSGARGGAGRPRGEPCRDLDRWQRGRLGRPDRGLPGPDVHGGRRGQAGSFRPVRPV